MKTAAPVPIVLAPGYMLDDDLWREFKLQFEGHAIFYADLTQDDTIAGMAARLIQDAPAQFLLIGFSMGGYVAREVARQAPERVVALVLVATSSDGDNAIQRKRKEAVARNYDPAKFAGLSRTAVLSSVAAAHRTSPLVDRILAMSARLGGAVFQRQSALIRTGDGDRLNEINRPTLIVAADQDELRTKEEALALHRGISGSRLEWISGSGHMIPLEAPEPLALIVENWLKMLNLE